MLEDILLAGRDAPATGSDPGDAVPWDPGSVRSGAAPAVGNGLALGRAGFAATCSTGVRATRSCPGSPGVSCDRAACRPRSCGSTLPGSCAAISTSGCSGTPAVTGDSVGFGAVPGDPTANICRPNQHMRRKAGSTNASVGNKSSPRALDGCPAGTAVWIVGALRRRATCSDFRSASRRNDMLRVSRSNQSATWVQPPNFASGTTGSSGQQYHPFRVRAFAEIP